MPPHHCAVCDNCTVGDHIPSDGEGAYTQCEEYIDRDLNNDTQKCSDGWQYDLELCGKSIASEWDLVCDQASWTSISQSTLLLGVATGSVIAGTIADKYGRRPIAIISIILFNILDVSVSFSTSYATFVTLRFFTGVAFKGIHLPTLVTALVEYLTPEYRQIIGNIPGLLFSLSAMMMSAIAYWVRDWRYFNLVSMAPTILAMGIIWFLPESVRWLISQGKYEEAEKRMQKVAKFNRAGNFPRPALKTTLAEGGELQTELEKEGIQRRKEKNLRTKSRPGHIFRPPTLTVTIVMSWMWISYKLIFFGFALSTGRLAGDPYANFFLSSLVEVPARLLSLFIIRRYGNLVPLMSFYTSAAICMVVIIVTNDDAGDGWVVTSFALLGKFLTVCTFPPMLMLSVVLFPTTSRTAGTGFIHLVGNIGSITSPILLYMDSFVPDLSLMVMSASAFLSALICLFLPETRLSVQPETPDDLKILFDSRRLLSCKSLTPPEDDEECILHSGTENPNYSGGTT